MGDWEAEKLFWEAGELLEGRRQEAGGEDGKDGFWDAARGPWQRGAGKQRSTLLSISISSYTPSLFSLSVLSVWLLPLKSPTQFALSTCVSHAKARQARLARDDSRPSLQKVTNRTNRARADRARCWKPAQGHAQAPAQWPAQGPEARARGLPRGPPRGQGGQAKGLARMPADSESKGKGDL